MSDPTILDPGHGLSRLAATGTLLGVETVTVPGKGKFAGKLITRKMLRLKCSQCGEEFSRQQSGSGMSARLQDTAYCGRECASKAAAKKFNTTGGGDSIMRFRFAKGGIE